VVSRDTTEGYVTYNILITIKHVKKMNNQTNVAIALLQQEKQTLQAITLFNYGPSQDVSSIIANEISYLEGMAITKPELLECEPASILMAMKYVLKSNLSLDPNSGLVYTKTRGFKKPDGSWGKVLEVQPTCEGLLSIAYQCGKIIDHERPSVSKNDKGQVIAVTFKYLRPSPTGPRWVEIEFDTTDFRRWYDKSKAENSRRNADAGANPNYTNFNGSIDPEFARAKSIRHALKKLGTNPNERLMVNIKPTMANTIAQDVDMNATGEDVPTNDYVEFKEVVAEPQATAPMQEDYYPANEDSFANLNPNDL
jgi:hypothetical protein